MRQGELHREENALEVDADDVVELGFADGAEAIAISDSGVRDDRVEAAQWSDQLVVQVFHVLLDRHIGSDAQAVGAEFRARVVEFVLSPARDDDLSALGDELFGDAEADSLRAAGNHGDLALALPPDGGHLVGEDVHHGKTASGVHS